MSIVTTSTPRTSARQRKGNARSRPGEVHPATPSFDRDGPAAPAGGASALGERATWPYAPVVPSVFVGRVWELDALARVIELGRAGGTAAALVTGDPGSGKTRLLAEASARVDVANRFRGDARGYCPCRRDRPSCRHVRRRACRATPGPPRPERRISRSSSARCRRRPARCSRFPGHWPGRRRWKDASGGRVPGLRPRNVRHRTRPSLRDRSSGPGRTATCAPPDGRPAMARSALGLAHPLPRHGRPRHGDVPHPLGRIASFGECDRLRRVPRECPSPNAAGAAGSGGTRTG